MLSRFVRFINWGVACIILFTCAAVYWYAYRPLPKITGELTAPISASAGIRRDARGIPHIDAASWQDAIFLQGFVTAQDRLWQMDVLRRFGSGQLAEVFGPKALPSDEESRRMRIRAIAEAEALTLRPSDRAVLVQYARGVNYFIDTHRGRYALEFALPGHSYDPRPWTVADSLVVGLVMFRDLTDSWKFELNKSVLFAHNNDPVRARTLFPAVQGMIVSPGSNAWAVSGARTYSGVPMLANDPHLSYGIPSTWHLVEMKAPGLHVIGAALPGVPCVITGHNDRIAWGVTNTQVDAADLYREQLDRRTGRYLFKGNVEQATLDQELIGVRDAKPVAMDIWVTRHGPILVDDGGKFLALQWTAAGGFELPFFDLDRARNWTEFRAALRDFWGPGQNFVYADRDGNIGYQATGKVPIRQGYQSDTVLDGASGRSEWAGFIPFDQMPSIYNPPSGLIATANQNPFPPDYPYEVDGTFSDPYRVNQIRTRLNAKQKLTVDDMLAVQKDVYSAYDSFLAKQVIAAAGQEGANASVGEAVYVLRSWNGQMDKDKPAPFITELLNAELGRALVQSLVQPESPARSGDRSEPESTPEKTGRRPVASGMSSREARPPISILPRPLVIQRLLTKRPKGWVPGDNWNKWLIANLVNALEAGRRQQGSPISRWKWGHSLVWQFNHPVGSHLPLVSGYFDIGPIPMSGSGTTVKQTTATLGPSERMVADLSHWDNSVQNLTVGESGHVASKHYRDQWPNYYVGKSFPMEFDKIDGVDTLRVVPQQ